MEILRAEKITFRYAGQEQNALSDLSFSVNRGEMVAICGATGSGKSTLLRLLKKELTPKGILQGSRLFKGKRYEELSPKESASQIGYVMQRPEEQLVTDKVWHELAFGPENMGVEPAEIRRRVAEISAYFGLEP
jgi:energy-coupling factor transport system ATP-binding protein